jgi:RHS repeat-associated protein
VGAVNASACSESPSNWPQGTNNNGDVAGYYYNDNANSGLKHAAIYQYDGANRLAGAAATGSVTYSQTFGYDAYGNMSCSPPGPGCVGFSYNPNTTTNQVTNAGYSYDLAGDLQTDGMYTYQWDAESRMVGVYQSGNVVSLNTYNALGQRVEDITQNSTTDEAYGAGGNLLLRYTGDSNSRSFVPFGGGILAEYFCGGIIFDHPDEIGSVTTSTDCTGSTVNEKLFKPFGESWTGAAMPNLGMHQEFAQLPDYDPETDQYNTLARHYTPMGRWMSPDPGGLKVVNLSNPQTWNMYAYATNNPTTLTDPSGLNPFPWLMANEFGQMLKMADKLTGGLEELEWENEEYEEYQQSGGGTQVAQATTEARSDPDQAQITSQTQAQQVTITYDENVPAMQPKTQEYVEKTATAAGVDSINISATTNGQHAPNSNHYNGTAVDINKVNGERVINAGKDPSVAANVRSIQNAANNPKNGVARENYGPAGLYKDGKQITNQKLQSQHEDHIHITIPRTSNDDN